MERKVGDKVQVVGPALDSPGLGCALNLPAPGEVTEINEGGSWPIVVQLDDGPLVKTTEAGLADRTLKEWKIEVDHDLRMIVHHLRDTEEEALAGSRVRNLALALKEARRLQSDIYRIARDIYGIERGEIDSIGPL